MAENNLNDKQAESEHTPEMLSHLFCASDKERLVRACHNLHDTVYAYVSSTNTIFRLLNEHLCTNFSIMPVKENFSIKDNLQLMVSALKEMQTTMETKGKDVEESIKLSLLAKISNSTTSLRDRITAVKEIYESYKGAVKSFVGALVAVMLKHDNFPGAVESALHQLLSSPALYIRVSELLIDYADIVKMLQQKETPSTTEGSSSGMSQHTGLQFLDSPSSVILFLHATPQGHRSMKKSLKIAADYLEEAFMVLKPSCEGFQTFVKMVGACVPAIIDKQQEA